MDLVVLVLITFVAATVNGALGYGFSSITVPVALLFYTNRILNPALVLVELVINGYVLFINRKSIPNIWWRVAPILIGLVIGVAIGSYILSLVHPAWVKFVTYFMLLPLILLQAAGIRKPIQAEKAIAIPFGVGIGTLYSVTTISGPPLALLFQQSRICQTGFPGRAGRHSSGRRDLHGNRLLLHWTLQLRQHGDHSLYRSQRPAGNSPRTLSHSLDGS